MTEKDLIDLGFNKVKVSEEESGDEPFYYYTWDPFPGSSFSLISCANDEISKIQGWRVDIFNNSKIHFFKKNDVKKLINLITNNIE